MPISQRWKEVLAQRSELGEQDVRVAGPLTRQDGKVGRSKPSAALPVSAIPSKHLGQTSFPGP